MLHFIRDLFRRRWKEIVGLTLSSQIPRACRWVAEQWAGDRVAQGLNWLGSWVWGWMASHPIQSLVVITSAILLGFSIETKIWEKRRAQAPGGDTLSATGVVTASQIEIIGEDHAAGILIGVTQTIDTLRSFSCRIALLDMKKVDDGKPYSIPDLHDRDGKFRFADVNLAAANGEELYYKAKRHWWLTEGSNSSPRIRYWKLENNSRGVGQISISRGISLVFLEISLTNDEKGNYSVKKKVAFLWDGTATPHVIEAG